MIWNLFPRTAMNHLKISVLERLLISVIIFMSPNEVQDSTSTSLLLFISHFLEVCLTKKDTLAN